MTLEIGMSAEGSYCHEYDPDFEGCCRRRARRQHQRRITDIGIESVNRVLRAYGPRDFGCSCC
jgi:hypothetical protein